MGAMCSDVKRSSVCHTTYYTYTSTIAADQAQGTVHVRYFPMHAFAHRSKVCNFFDDDFRKQPFHCDGCGICRVGGAHNFFHCETCGCCYARELHNNHKCIKDSMHQNCPICQENLFNSTLDCRVGFPTSVGQTGFYNQYPLGLAYDDPRLHAGACTTSPMISPRCGSHPLVAHCSCSHGMPLPSIFNSWCLMGVYRALAPVAVTHMN